MTSFDFDVISDKPALKSRPPEAASPAKPSESPVPAPEIALPQLDAEKAA